MTDFKPSGNVHGETDHVKSTDTRQTSVVPSDQWVDVHAGQALIDGTQTETRDEYPGVLFDKDTGAVTCWHLSRNIFYCVRRGIKPEQVVIDPQTGAGWCPTCFSKKHQLERKEQRKIKNKLKRKKGVTRAGKKGF